jgi:sugar lactone lactonase YvrE
LAVDSSGNLYIADAGNSIWKVERASQLITVVLGSLQVPVGLAFDHAGNLCFTEWEIGTVSCMDLKTKSVKRVAGTGTPGFSGDGGSPLKAQLNQPSGIVFDAEDNLYISDSGNQRIHVIRRRPSGERPR